MSASMAPRALGMISEWRHTGIVTDWGRATARWKRVTESNRHYQLRNLPITLMSLVGDKGFGINF
jgi:hypothetical protein